MRTYEVTLMVTRFEKVLVQHENRGLGAQHAVGQEALAKTTTCEGESAKVWSTKDITPKEPTDKDRFNDAFKAIRKLGYAAKQNRSRYETEFGEGHVMTMKDDADAFHNGELIGMIPIHWDSDTLKDDEVHTIMRAFLDEGFNVNWSGKWFHCIEIRKGNE